MNFYDRSRRLKDVKINKQGHARSLDCQSLTVGKKREIADIDMAIITLAAEPIKTFEQKVFEIFNAKPPEVAKAMHAVGNFTTKQAAFIRNA